ncbi:MAG: hypothetical protein LQ350_008668 [Teloschistes chrysophthalmus]|nr:MAG: hypothetical protein LQ350_008668 [Niorma chrysophthalma]
MDPPKIEILSNGAPVAETDGRSYLPDGAPFTIRISFAKESPMLSKDVSFGVLMWTDTHDREVRHVYSAMFRKEDLKPSDVGLSNLFLGTYEAHEDKKIQLPFQTDLTVSTYVLVMKVQSSVIKGLLEGSPCPIRTPKDRQTFEIAQALACGPSTYFTQGDCHVHWQTSPIAHRVWRQQTYGKNTTGKNGEADNHTATTNPEYKLSRPAIQPPLSRKNSSIPPTNANHIHQFTSPAIQTYRIGYVTDPAERVQPYGKLPPPSAANPRGTIDAKAEDSFVLVSPFRMLPPRRSGGFSSGEDDIGGELQIVVKGEDEEEFFDVGDELVEWEIV